MSVQKPPHFVCPPGHPVGVLHTPPEHVPPPGQLIWLPEQPPPLLQVSPVVQAFPSSQEAPLGLRWQAIA
ncbi:MULTISPECIES: hypothetical protein [unclassified Corallococcus]|uniref:hypothetical protein n=1 Tax=unclassified Corallococcus TaxID=2685029 RepID=UPI001CBB3149|nr:MULTISPECIES: hypothetical protein [unclassified Corallococcus]MBZ4334926.1 hypothetical protein [Corallococcus sp. AS-1-12]MBZ4376439.1 hypothetical protein [Corallococcus sp. AS-1-6]